MTCGGFVAAKFDCTAILPIVHRRRNTLEYYICDRSLVSDARAAHIRTYAIRRFYIMPTLLLLRHATPTSKEEDPAQPLSPEGVVEAEFTAHAIACSLGFDSRFGKPAGPPPPLDLIVVHSGKARAEQTAGCVRDMLVLGGAKLIGNPEDAEALAPNADPSLAIELMSSLVIPEHTCLSFVGHLPMLHKLAAALGISEATADHFVNAGGLMLERSAVSDAPWLLKHFIDTTSWWMEAPPPAS